MHWSGSNLYSWNFQGIDVIQMSRIDPDQLVSCPKGNKIQSFYTQRTYPILTKTLFHLYLCLENWATWYTIRALSWGLKPACSTTEISYYIEILHEVSLGIIIYGEQSQTAWMDNWSAPLFSTCKAKISFFDDKAHKQMSRDMWFPTMLHFDKCRLRRVWAASF